VTALKACARTAIGLLIGITAAAAVVFWLGISHQDVTAALHGAQLSPLVFALFGALVLLGLQSLRWWIVMRPVLHLGYWHAYKAMMVGFCLNVMLPARGGDLLRVQYLGKRTGVSRAKLLGTEVVDFWSDKWGWVVALPVVWLIEPPPPWLYNALLPFGATVLGVGLLLTMMASGRWRRGPAWLINLCDGFAANNWKQLLPVETFIAPLPWLWETFVIFVAGHALGLELSVMQSFATLTAFNLASIVPSPGNAGSFEAGGTLALVAFGISKETALAFTFVYHLTQVIPGFIGGILVLVLERETLFGKKKLTAIRAAPATAIKSSTLS
jgi:uncharacterized membrane protein YbhN (UPF0104 family)